ncbi:MAG: HAD family hydrolase [Candidatus Doudnabacteria bacterium]|nr:HAD family hydrolase [Candidatus Doudnabacteria bacterium]
MNIKAIIFDWGGTLFDKNGEISGAYELLTFCKAKGYRLAVATITTMETGEERINRIKSSRLGKFFEIIKACHLDPSKVHEVTDDKGRLFDKIVEYFNFPQSEIMIIGDRTFRDIRYATLKGHPSIWVKNGKFAHELPNDQTGQPTYTVKYLSEIMKII